MSSSPPSKTSGKKMATVAPEPVSVQVELEQPPVAVTVDPPQQPKPDHGISQEQTSARYSQVQLPANLVAEWEHLRHDAAQLSAALRQQLRFEYMASDSIAVHGLRDWSLGEWCASFERNPGAAAKFLDQFLPAEQRPAQQPPSDAAALVKARLDSALEAREWQLVCRYQNLAGSLERGVAEEHVNGAHYLESALLWNHLVERDFPLGVEPPLVEEPWGFAVAHSGLRDVGHRKNSVVTLMVYASMAGVLLFGVTFMLQLMVGDAALWELERGTVQDTSSSALTSTINSRTKDRGTVASCLQSFAFSLTVNAHLDKFGKIDPSTSTVFVGMTLGGTFGFVLDNMLGSDEGFREYLWSPQRGMKYAIGALATARYGRYLLTIIFDMFFTVILFKLLYSKLVRLAGFSTNGREWIANGMCSMFISVVTYQVYANMTRFEWAYPSGVEDVNNQWISGQTMILAIVIMNMVYLISETRVKVGERGINDPPVKVAVTMLTYLGIFLIQDYVDPSVLVASSNASSVDAWDTSLPLGGVCETQSYWQSGALVFSAIAVSCLGFVIFVTSKQPLSGLRQVVVGGGPPPPARPTRADALLGKLLLFAIFLLVTLLIILLFAFTPFYAAGGSRNTTAVRVAGVTHSSADPASSEAGRVDWLALCDDYGSNVAALTALGLS